MLLIVLQFGGKRWQTELVKLGRDFEVVGQGEVGHEAAHEPLIKEIWSAVKFP